MKSHPLAGLRRPRILIATARDLKNRNKGKSGLRRLAKLTQKLSSGAAIRLLRQQESEAEARRQALDGTYNARQHVQILAALMLECQNMKSDKAVGH